MKAIDELLVTPAHQLRGEKTDTEWQEYVLELMQKCEQALNALAAQAGETGLRFEIHSTGLAIDGEVVVRGRLRPEQVNDLRVTLGLAEQAAAGTRGFPMSVWAAREALLSVGLDLREEVSS